MINRRQNKQPKEMSSQLKWGIIGCNMLSGDVVDAIRILPHGENRIVAVCAHSIHHCEEFIKKHALDSVKCYSNYEELVVDAQVDVVYVSSRTHRTDIVLAAANAKKNILCETPMGKNKKEVEMIIKCAEENQVFLQEGHWSRFFPIYGELDELISSGRIGDVQIVQASMGLPSGVQFERLNQIEFGGSMALNVARYLIQFALVIFDVNTAIESVHVHGWETHSLSGTCSIMIKFAGKRLAHLLLSGSGTLAGRAQICGTKGRIDIPDFSYFPEYYEVKILPDRLFNNQVLGPFTQPKAHGDLEKFILNFTAGLARQADAVRRHVLLGDKESSEVTHEESLKAAEILDLVKLELGIVEAPTTAATVE